MKYLNWALALVLLNSCSSSESPQPSQTAGGAGGAANAGAGGTAGAAVTPPATGGTGGASAGAGAATGGVMGGSGGSAGSAVGGQSGGGAGGMGGLSSVPEGYTPLLNGDDISAFGTLLRDASQAEADQVFVFDPDGTLHFFRDLPAGTGAQGQPNENGTHGMLYTKRNDYSRFSLKFEYKWGLKLFNNSHSYQYDSGLLYHADSALQVWPSALQYQIRYNHLENKNHSGDFVANYPVLWYSKDGNTFELPANGGTDRPNGTGELYAHVDATSTGPNGEWNECELIVMSNKWAIHKLNGKLANMATNLGASSGRIALEVETGEILWRNVFIKEFDQDMPMEPFLE